ncbi:hypothetical protein GUITHDRAFT_163453 [Guillardia theta CCMP2712]|uniref:GOLD domain-containing protein n=1 Tax=Guillardia theta (strain CCMP2712) TaxID=905079 RepID=L1J8H3_GUITC|nr:hypothetical protein GUITHDRAFT_163453 [Guillardia theta CCMP2712]EKX44811.1 hypothetical protein GUITHDRAFT_163453 [Guillardia theta CCMP2712]|eukprot:XP_005831791.1 hypothetical protein GUITHDRAFT_163453 [Guillardia theta CCMP2712]
MDDVPLVASEGVGSGGVGHYCSGKVNVFRLPPPIPGKEGGGYPSEWHHAQIVIRRNYMIHKLRNAGKKIPEAQDPKAESDPEAQKAKMRKRDLIKKYADSGLNFIKGVADKVSHNETLQKTAGRVGHAVSEAHAYTGKLVHGLAHKKHDKSGETAEDVQGEEANRYPGWMMERIKTASIGVGFFLKRREHGALSSETPFQLACKQERVQIIEIAARDQLKTTHVVQNGDVLKWIFAAKAHDVAFQVKIRKMMEVGGANEEVDSKSIAEGTYEVTEAGQVVVVLDNSYSLLTSKTIAYRTWVEKAAEVEGGAAKSSASESIQQDDGIVELSPTATEEGKPAADAAQENSEKAGAAKQAEEEAAAKKAEEEEAAAAAAKKAEEEEAAAAAKKAEEEAAAAAAKKAEEEAAAAAAKKAEEEAAAAAAKKAEEEAAAAAAKKAEEEAAAAKKAEEEAAAAAKKAEEEAAAAAAKKAEEEAAAAKKAEEEAAAAAKKAEEEAAAAAAKKAEEEAAAAKKAEEAAAAAKKAEEEAAAAAAKKAEEEAAAAKKAEEEAAAAKKAEEEAATEEADS